MTERERMPAVLVASRHYDSPTVWGCGHALVGTAEGVLPRGLLRVVEAALRGLTSGKRSFHHDHQRVLP